MFLTLSSYVTTLDSIKETLSLKDSHTMNLFVILSSGFNSSTWMGYAILVGDFYIFLPCFIGFLVFFISLVLYFWTLELLDHNNIVIILLKMIFLKEEQKDTPKRKISSEEQF